MKISDRQNLGGTCMHLIIFPPPPPLTASALGQQALKAGLKDHVSTDVVGTGSEQGESRTYCTRHYCNSNSLLIIGVNEDQNASMGSPEEAL